MKKCNFILFFLLCTKVILVAAENKVTFSADRIVSRNDENQPKIDLIGSARFYNKEFDLTADMLSVFGKNYDLLNGYGRVQLENKSNHTTVRANELIYDTKISKITAEGNVELLYPDENIKMRSEFFESIGNKNPLICRGAVRIFHENFFARADMAIYNLDKQVLVLQGNAYITQEGQSFKAYRMNINIKTQAIILEEGIQGELLKKNEDKIDEPQ
jgi:lipopolysaccharide export system protein LptA